MDVYKTYIGPNGYNGATLTLFLLSPYEYRLGLVNMGTMSVNTGLLLLF